MDSDLIKEGIGNGTLKLLHKVHNIVMKFGCKEDYVRYNYAHEAFKGFDVPLKTRKALTIQQQYRFVEFLKENDQFHELYNVVVFMLETAIRVSEMSSLTLPDIDLENGIASIDKQYLNQIIGKEDHSNESKMISPKTEASIVKFHLMKKQSELLLDKSRYMEVYRQIKSVTNVILTNDNRHYLSQIIRCIILSINIKARLNGGADMEDIKKMEAFLDELEDRLDVLDDETDELEEARDLLEEARDVFEEVSELLEEAKEGMEEFKALFEKIKDLLDSVES